MCREARGTRKRQATKRRGLAWEVLKKQSELFGRKYCRGALNNPSGGVPHPPVVERRIARPLSSPASDNRLDRRSPSVQTAGLGVGEQT